MSLTARILSGMLVAILAAWLLLISPALDRVERQYLEAAEEPMVDTAELIAALMSARLANGEELPGPLVQALPLTRQRQLEALIYDQLKTSVEMNVMLTDEYGIVIYDSADSGNVGRNFSSYLDIHNTLAGNYGARSTRIDEADATSSVMYVAAPVLDTDGNLAGVVSISKPQRSMLGFILETRRKLKHWALAGIIAFMLFGIFLSWWVTQPLKRLTGYAESVAAGDKAPLPPLPGRHLRTLGYSLESMRNALENRQYVENYVQSLTHEMKSPLAGIRSAAELLEGDPPTAKRNQFLDNISSETDRLQRLVDQLLALASLENQKSITDPQPVDLLAITRRLVDDYSARYPDLDFRLEAPDAATVNGDEFLLETAISNLLSNAVEFSPADGHLDLAILRSNNFVTCTIADHGPGIPAFAQDKIFHHFYSLPRPGSGRKSSGLGLCFVAEAAKLHNGEIAIVNRETGSGTLATLKLPAA